MRALTVKQPWAHLIAVGEKTIEVRSRNTKHRGDLVIHSSARPDDRMAEFCEGLPLGSAICIVTLVGARPLEIGDVDAALLPDDWRPDECEGQWAWLLENPREIKPVPWRGALNFWELPDALIVYL